MSKVKVVQIALAGTNDGDYYVEYLDDNGRVWTWAQAATYENPTTKELEKRDARWMQVELPEEPEL